MDFNENRTKNSRLSRDNDDTVSISNGNNTDTDNDSSHRSSQRNKSLIWIGVGTIVVAALLFLFVWFYLSGSGSDETEGVDSVAAKELALQQELAKSELENADKDLVELEGQRDLVLNDSVKMRLTQKYEAARLEIEKLQAQLQDTKNRSAKEIEDLRGQIKTLRELLKHYLEEIARLNQENEELRAENAQIKDQNQQLSSQVASTTAQNQVLSERMTLAEKLNVTGVSLTPLKDNGKTEKKVKKARQMMVTFTIPQNNSTPVGEKTIFLRVVSPEGNLIGSAGNFAFEGTTVPCSARKVIEYEGAEMAGLAIYVNVNTALSPGEYTVELFADSYRLASRRFTLK